MWCVHTTRSSAVALPPDFCESIFCRTAQGPNNTSTRFAIGSAIKSGEYPYIRSCWARNRPLFISTKCYFCRTWRHKQFILYYFKEKSVWNKFIKYLIFYMNSYKWRYFDIVIKVSIVIKNYAYLDFLDLFHR